MAGTSQHKLLVVGLLWFFLGTLGIHRFLVGKVGTGILMLITGGGFLIWWLIDGVVLALGSFTDKDGDVVNQWT